MEAAPPSNRSSAPGLAETENLLVGLVLLMPMKPDEVSVITESPKVPELSVHFATCPCVPDPEAAGMMLP